MRTPLLVLAFAFLLPACDGSVSQAVQATTTGSTGGAGGASPQFCNLTVTGAIDVTVTSDPQASSVIAGSMLSCGDDIAPTGSFDSLGIYFTGTQGPGTYASSAADDWFQYAVCSDPQSCDPVDDFGGGPGSSGCTFVLTVAPDSYQEGALIAGSFSCPALVGQSDSTQSVSVSGTFSTVIRPPPC
jgi:hypothetical protein